MDYNKDESEKKASSAYDETEEDEDDFAIDGYEDEDVLPEEPGTAANVSAKKRNTIKMVKNTSDKRSEEKSGNESKAAGFLSFIKRIKFKLIAGFLIVLILFAGFMCFALSTITQGRIMNNVYVQNLDVSGLTYDEAVASIAATYIFENSEITLTNGEKTFKINGADIGLSAVAEETAKKAIDYCKTGNVLERAWNAAGLLFSKHVIIPAAEADTAQLDEKLNECGNFMLGEWKQHYIEFTGENTATIYSGQTGYNGDPSKVHEQVMQAMSNEQFHNIHVDFDAAEPYEMTVDALDALIYKDPVNAEFIVDGNEVTVTDDESGRYIDKETVAPLLEGVYEGCEPVEVPFLISQAEVTKESLTSKLFADTLSSYSTNYGGSTENRSKNVARAASLLSGTVVAPGEVFSFNDTVGRRTTENGFYTAKEYMNGESVDGIGGGTCQVSSTLYSAVLYADLAIVARLNHMMSVGYIPLGQDATVADGGVDFRFRNTSDYPIKIAASTNGSTITISIVGTAWDPPREVKISNNVTTSGENTVVYSKRYVYSDGELIATESLNSSTYMPHGGYSSQNNDDEDDDDDYDYDDDE